MDISKEKEFLRRELMHFYIGLIKFTAFWKDRSSPIILQNASIKQYRSLKDVTAMLDTASRSNQLK